MKIAILADIHANIYALDAALADCREEGVVHLIVAGDLVGYYYWPQSVIERLMNYGHVTCIRGNHEDILAETLDCQNASRRYREKYGSGFDVCHESLCGDEIRWLLHLPASAKTVIGDTQFSVHHGSPSSTDEYIYPDAAADVLVRCHDSRDFTILGHTHYSFVHNRNGSTLLNPGSIGQSRELGGLACYAVVDLDNHAVRFKRIPYDVHPVVAAALAHDPKLCYLQRIMTRRAL